MSRSCFVQLLSGLSGSVALRAQRLFAPAAPALHARFGKTTGVRWAGLIESGSLVVFDCKADFV